MSTLVGLQQAGHLIRFQPELDHGAFETRQLYLLSRVPAQVDERVRGSGSDRNLEIEPEAQLEGLLADFCEGIQLITDSQFKCLRPVIHGVWELKTPDLRLFGWFYRKDCFIWGAVDAKWRLRQMPGLVNGYVTELVRIRSELFGDDSHVASERPDDVISNWC